MSSETLERRFAAAGARLKVADAPWRGEPRIDVRTDRRGECFDLRFAGGERGVELGVVDVQPPAIRELVRRTHPKDPFRRRNAAYLRQGDRDHATLRLAGCIAS